MSRPRPGRAPTAGLTEALHNAAAQILSTCSYADLTVTALTAATGMSRPTFYRRFPDVDHLVLTVVAERCTVPVIKTGSLQGDLVAAQRHQVALLADPVVRRGLLGLLGAAQRDEHLAARVNTELINPWRAVLARILDAAVRRGELPALPPPAQVDVLVDLLRGPLLLRALHDPRGLQVDDASGGEQLAARTAATALLALKAAGAARPHSVRDAIDQTSPD